MEDVIYLDNNATTRLDPRVFEEMIPYLRNLYGNPSSSHHFGSNILKKIQDVRNQVSELLNCDENDLIFTSGATESVNLAMKGFAFQNQHKGKHIVTTNAEHKSVLETCKYLESVGFEISYLPVEKNGLIELALLKNLIRSDTILVSVMWVNNETGTIQPIEEITKITFGKGIAFFTDATQAVGKIPIDLSNSKIDLLAFSAHKFYGPKGVGGLYVRGNKTKSVKIQVLSHGGDHEFGLRSGTLNVPGIVGLGKACEIARLEMTNDEARVASLRDLLEADLLKITPSFINGSTKYRLYNVTNICFLGLEADVLIGRMKNVAISNGSACTSSIVEPSHVLKALGLNDDEALASIRFSLGRFNTAEEIKIAVDVIKSFIPKHALNHA